MCVIGITGGFGTGKSTVAKMFAGFGARIIDADNLAHRLMRPGSICFREIVKLFGKDVLTRGRVDRKKIAEIVFRDSKKLRALEKIIHPRVCRLIIAKIKEYKARNRKAVVVVDVPLLFEVKLNRDMDISVVVKASKAKQLKRATKTLDITKSEANRRIRAQMPLRQKIRLADIIIDNDGTINQTKKQVKQIWEKL